MSKFPGVPESESIRWHLMRAFPGAGGVHGYSRPQPWLDIDFIGYDEKTRKLYIQFMDEYMYEFDDSNEEEFLKLTDEQGDEPAFSKIPYMREVLRKRGHRIWKPANVDMQADERRRFEGKE